MEVILLEKVARLGNLGDRVKVRAGYGRNFLIPRGKATSATPENIARFEERRAQLERLAADALAHAEARREALEGLEVRITAARTGADGRLFGSVGPGDIADAVTAAGYELDKRELRLNTPIRHVGEYEVTVHLHHDVNATMHVMVVAQ